MYLREADAVDTTPVEAGDGLAKAVLIGEDAGAPHFAMREFTLAADGTVPKHTNAVEHVQYVLDGEYIVGAGTEDEATEHRVAPGDAMLIPAGEVHWYRNASQQTARFLCTVPHGETDIRILDSA